MKLNRPVQKMLTSFENKLTGVTVRLSEQFATPPASSRVQKIFQYVQNSDIAQATIDEINDSARENCRNQIDTLKHTNTNSDRRIDYRQRNNGSRNQATDVKPEVTISSSNEDTCSKGLSDDQTKSYVRVQHKDDEGSSFMLNRDLKPRLQFMNTNDHIKSWDFSVNPLMIYKKIAFEKTPNLGQAGMQTAEEESRSIRSNRSRRNFPLTGMNNSFCNKCENKKHFKVKERVQSSNKKSLKIPAYTIQFNKKLGSGKKTRNFGPKTTVS